LFAVDVLLLVSRLLLIVVVLQERRVVERRMTGQSSPHRVLQEQAAVRQTREPRACETKPDAPSAPPF